MKVKYIGHEECSLIHGKVYEVIGIEYGYYRIVDESEEDYLYSPTVFEVVETEDNFKGR